MRKEVMQTEELKLSLELINNWISLADSKATFLLTITTFFLSASIFALPNIHKSIIEYLQYPSVLLSTSCIIILTLYFSSSLLSLLSLIQVIKPRLKKIGKKTSLLYFMDISNMEIEEYQKELMSLSNGQLKEHMIGQIYANSQVAKKKYENLDTAINFLVASLVTGLLLMIVSIK